MSRIILDPTPEQKRVLEETKHCAVIASPGSGKTFTLSVKIKGILPTLPDHKGVVAISFTNKASDELKRRCLSSGLDPKCSFFGTIDSFFLSEVIIPFGIHLFGLPPGGFQKTIDFKDISDAEDLDKLGQQGLYDEIKKRYLALFENYFVQGKVILQSFGFLALYIVKNSLACRRYLKARYSHVVVDEYQDCDYWQHSLFIELVDEIGLVGIVVGDVNQSIFAFAHKDPKFLIALARRSDFETFPLSENHRCHTSITNYATRLLVPESELIDTDEMRVLEKHVDGSEIHIAQWLSRAIAQFAELYQTNELRQIAILTRSRRTANLVHNSLSIPHKPVLTTALDNDSSLWGALFRRILSVIFSLEQTKYEVVEKFLNIEFKRTKVKRVMRLLNKLVEAASPDATNLQHFCGDFIAIGNILAPGQENENAIESLRGVLQSATLLDSYIPPQSHEVQLMTLHRAKGLEFDIVFHLDLYRFILPQYNSSQEEFTQYLNLHYVGITRARHCCVLCVSTQRHNYEMQLRDAEPSEFLCLNDLSSLRELSPF